MKGNLCESVTICVVIMVTRFTSNDQKFEHPDPSKYANVFFGTGDIRKSRIIDSEKTSIWKTKIVTKLPFRIQQNAPF